MSKTVLIAGISGQDGSILSKKLSKKGFEIIGLSRKKRASSLTKKILKTKNNKDNSYKLLENKPKMIFNFTESNPKL